MKQDGMYYKVTQEYHHLHREKIELMQQRDKIDERLRVLEDVLVDLNGILCKHGSHIYEHFEESEPQESEDKDADKKCTYKETGCGSCKRQLDCPIEADKAERTDT